MQAKRDANRIPTLLGTLNTDGVTPNLIYANPATHRMNVSGNPMNVSGNPMNVSGNPMNVSGNPNASRDENRIPVAMAISSADGITPIPIYSDDLYNLLITNS